MRICGIGIHCMELCRGMSKSMQLVRELGKNKEKIGKKLWSEELDSVKYKVLDKLEREKRSGKGKRRKR